MPSYFRVMPRELCPLKLSGIGSAVRQSNEVSSAAGGMSGCRGHQLHRHLVNSSAITVNRSCSLLTFLWHPSPRDAGLCTKALWGMWGCVCVRILGQKLGLLKIQLTTLRCSQSTPYAAALQGQSVPPGRGYTWTICWRLGCECGSRKHPKNTTTTPMGSGYGKTPDCKCGLGSSLGAPSAVLLLPLCLEMLKGTILVDRRTCLAQHAPLFLHPHCSYTVLCIFPAPLAQLNAICTY